MKHNMFRFYFLALMKKKFEGKKQNNSEKGAIFIKKNFGCFFSRFFAIVTLKIKFFK